ncbi:MAG: beta-lactamase family protein [Pyrinomonadaceae bacterium]|nr:beta-lactamase family protein [Pyrinomonadaceae bacterium]
MKKLTALFLLSVILGSIIFGQAPKTTETKTTEAPKPTESGKPEMTAADVEAFLDGIVPAQIAQNDIAGATISVVKDGKLLFAKGYGYSDVKGKKPVSPETTLFRPGSVSKLFTWTAVMQLVEQGKLDLNKDVNEYLDFKIPEAFGKPITLTNILTHTPGFEEQIKDLFTLNQESPNLGEYLKTHIPARIFPPGTVPAYSNYATALAGYIVERVSGKPFNDYIADNIFKPLGMTHSTFAQPLPADFAPNMSNGYQLASDDPKGFENINAFPAGSLSSSAVDMSKFMLAHLLDGKLGDAQILKPETAKLMHSRLFGLDDAAPGMAHGFYEESRNGHRIIGHGGDTMWFHSDLHLVLDAGVGFFISYNSQSRGHSNPREVIWHSFLDRYFPYKIPETPTLETAKQDAQTVAGNYIGSRRAEMSAYRSLAVLSQAQVIANEDGTILFPMLNSPNGKPIVWREVAPMTFQEVDGQDKLIFKPDENGKMQVIMKYPFMTFTKTGTMENGKLLLMIAGLSLGIMALTLILWFVAWIVRRRYGHKLELSPLEWKLRWAVRIVFALNLIFVIALTSFVLYAFSHLEALSDSGTTKLMIIQVIGVIASIGSLVVFYNFVHTWLSKNFQIWGKLQATVFALATIGILWLIYAANLLSFATKY